MAAFQIIRGGVAPIDLATVQLSDGSSLYMTIMASWGMIADVDIESEKFRKLGKARFTLGRLYILFLCMDHLLLKRWDKSHCIHTSLCKCIW